MRRTSFALAISAFLSATLSAQQPPTPPAPQPQVQPAPDAQPQPTPPPAPAPTTDPAVPPVEPPPPAAAQPPRETPPANVTAPDQQPSILSRAAGASYDRRESLPNVNIYLPEGQASIRLRKLIRNVLFESQIDYKFVEGDISTFLRYKYYARNFWYKLSVFDSIEFPDVGSTSKQEFERVRGGLFLTEFPRDYNKRYFWLLQNDRLTFGDTTNVDNRKNNVYTKVGFQYGTQFDERMNAIVGESRGRITPVLTAFRELGPQKFGFAAAVTQSGHVWNGDYNYTKLESEVLKRWDVSRTSFFVSRAHVGFFAVRNTVSTAPTTDPIERYSIPRYEMFKLGGREALRSISDNTDSEGTHEAHLTNEYFVPIFRNKDFRTWLLHWNTMYGIAYVGAGSVGFDYRDLGKSDRTVVDAGIGTEMSINVRDFDVLFSVIYAHTVHGPEELRGGKVRFSIRTIR
ncbi:MAG: hypothetical protein JOZ54_03030 [Acidobacteria bacterium]|nr:hypothetical protein [Acidobacteriota bacterium]